MSDLTLPHYTNQYKSPSPPPLSNRGVVDEFSSQSRAGVFVQLDWLRYSVGWPENSVQGGDLGRLNELRRLAFRTSVMPVEGLHLTGEVLPPPKGYNARLGMTYGSVRFHSEIITQKIGVEFTARDLDGLRSLDCDLVKYLGWVGSRRGGKVTRLDVAVDYYGLSNPLDLHRAFLADELVSRAQNCQVIEGHRRVGEILESGGATVYIGSRTSDRFLRVYDKALELGRVGENWTRIELQLGGDWADEMARAFVADPDAFADLARGAVRGFCQAPSVGWFSAALDGPLVELPKIICRDSDRKRWLMKQVMPAIRAELAECEKVGDWELYASLRSAMAMYDARAGV